jgi:hypothetical protein
MRTLAEWTSWDWLGFVAVVGGYGIVIVIVLAYLVWVFLPMLRGFLRWWLGIEGKDGAA